MKLTIILLGLLLVSTLAYAGGYMEEATTGWVISNFARLIGFTMQGDINMNGNNIINATWVNMTNTSVEINYTQLSDEHWWNESPDIESADFKTTGNVSGENLHSTDDIYAEGNMDCVNFYASSTVNVGNILELAPSSIFHNSEDTFTISTVSNDVILPNEHLSIDDDVYGIKYGEGADFYEHFDGVNQVETCAVGTFWKNITGCIGLNINNDFTISDDTIAHYDAINPLVLDSTSGTIQIADLIKASANIWLDSYTGTISRGAGADVTDTYDGVTWKFYDNIGTSINYINWTGFLEYNFDNNVRIIGNITSTGNISAERYFGDWDGGNVYGDVKIIGADLNVTDNIVLGQYELKETSNKIQIQNLDDERTILNLKPTAGNEARIQLDDIPILVVDADNSYIETVPSGSKDYELFRSSADGTTAYFRIYGHPTGEDLKYGEHKIIAGEKYQITTDTGEIDFDDENLTTTGNISAENLHSTGNIVTEDNVTAYGGMCIPADSKKLSLGAECSTDAYLEWANLLRLYSAGDIRLIADADNNEYIYLNTDLDTPQIKTSSGSNLIINSSGGLVSFADDALIEDDLTVSGQITTSLIETEGTTGSLLIQPDAIDTTPAVVFFNNVETTDRPTVRIKGYKDSGTVGVKYSDLSIDTWGRLLFGGTSDGVMFQDQVLEVNGDIDDGAYLRIDGNRHFGFGVTDNNLGGGGLHPVIFSQLNAGTPVHVFTSWVAANNNFNLKDEATPAVMIHDGTATATNYGWLQHDGTDFTIKSGTNTMKIHNTTTTWTNESGDASVIINRNGTIFSKGYATLSNVYDKDNGKALDLIKDSDEWRNPDGSINKASHHAYITTEVTDYSKPVIEYHTVKECEDINLLIEDCPKDMINETEKEITTYPYTKILEGLDMETRIITLEQSIYELKEQNLLLTQRIEALEQK